MNEKNGETYGGLEVVEVLGVGGVPDLPRRILMGD